MVTLNNYRGEFAQIVSTVRHNVRWYDEIVAGGGYDDSRDPANLPLIDEPLLTKHYYDVDGPIAEGTLTYQTSGTSTGARKKIHYSTRDHLDYVAQRKEIFSRFLTPDCKVACSDLGTGHAASSAAEIFGELGLESFHIDYRRPVAEHIELLNKHRPDVLFTMPMILDSLIQTGEIAFQPKKIIVVGDVASRAWKKHIVDEFGLARTDLLDIIGSIEVGSIAHECFACGGYHFDDHIIPETVAPSVLFAEVESGSAEVLILTSRNRTVFPAIRFVTNDLIEGFGWRKCQGRYAFTFERMIGRLGDELKNGEKISLYDISEAVNTYLPGGLFEVQKDSQKFVIKICSVEFTSEIGEQIKHFIKQLNPDVKQLIESSLVQDIDVCPVAIEELTRAAKMSFIQKR
jgi:phenylacetate-coenzyme A ligase PaaK-like adenylate-forming protein